MTAAVGSWWRDQRRSATGLTCTRRLLAISYEFLRDSLPDRRRQRFGDFDYDWEFRVDTTSANVSWRSRLIGLLNSPYQPVDRDLFHEMMRNADIDPSQFTFIDVGSGKGRALLLASEYSFRRVIGLELLPELSEIACENIQKFSGRNPLCGPVESVCCDATQFAFPEVPTVVFLNNPLSSTALKKLVSRITSSLQSARREIVLVYANPLLEHILVDGHSFQKVAGTHQYSIFRNDVVG